MAAFFKEGHTLSGKMEIATWQCRGKGSTSTWIYCSEVYARNVLEDPNPNMEVRALVAVPIGEVEFRTLSTPR